MKLDKLHLQVPVWISDMDCLWDSTRVAVIIYCIWHSLFWAHCNICGIFSLLGSPSHCVSVKHKTGEMYRKTKILWQLYSCKIIVALDCTFLLFYMWYSLGWLTCNIRTVLECYGSKLNLPFKFHYRLSVPGFIEMQCTVCGIRHPD
jgi:hypothetical protein